MGHCISVLLNTLQKYHSKTLRRETLSAMLAITGVNSEDLIKELSFSHQSKPSSDVNIDASSGEGTSSPPKTSSSVEMDPSDYLSTMKKVIGLGGCESSVFASFLPGMTIGLTKLITTDSTTGSSVIVLSLLTWAHYVCLVLDDSHSASLTAPPTTEKEKHELVVLRTKQWESDTDHKLSVLVQRMSVLVTSEEWRVRVVMVGWAHCMLTHCYRYDSK